MEGKGKDPPAPHGHAAYHMLDAAVETRSLILPAAPPSRSLFRALFCCFRSSVSITQAGSWKARWRAIKEKYSQRKTQRDAVFHALLALPLDRTSIAELEKLNLSPSGTHRNDLEFYVPQLCNFVLFGDFEPDHREDLVRFLLEACRTSFHFYHRVMWFLQATSLEALEMAKVSIERLMKAVEIAVRGSQRLYVGRGADLLSLCNRLDLPLFPDLLAPHTLPPDQSKRNRISAIIAQYKHNSDSPLPEIDPQLLTLFPGFADSDSAFQATLSLVQALTDAAVLIASAVDKKEELSKLLSEINAKLPAAVYLPLTKTRNCVLLQLHVSELKLFKTKERAPFLVCFETFDPYEEFHTLEVSPEGSRRQRSPSLSLDRLVRRLTTVAQEQEEEADRTVENISYPVFQQIMNEASEVVTSRSECGTPPRLSMGVEIGQLARTSPDESHEDEDIQRHIHRTGPTIMYVYDCDSEDESPHRSPEDRRNEAFGESSAEQESRLRALSPFRAFSTWGLVRVIVKAGEDLRQEQFAMQLITQFQDIFQQAKLNLWLRPYEIVATGRECGLIECVSDAVSIDSLKKSMPATILSLADFFHWYFRTPHHYKKARKHFVTSLAAYSLVCYVLQIKDRHNGNILLDRSGHVIHIDFGFMISNAPGSIAFEQAPFKLTDELVEVMGGVRSSAFRQFRKLCAR